MSDSVLIDTHVHLYKLFDLDAALTAANKNMSALDPNAKLHVLCITERVGDFEYGFDAIQNNLKKFQVTTSSSHSITVKNISGNSPELMLIRGRQFVSSEKIEVLGLGYLGGSLEGKPLNEIVSGIEQANSLPVLPWSPGKWLGKRGEVISNFIKNHQVCVGDIRIRPNIAPQPKLFKIRLTRLPGSDPLPIYGEEKDIGCYVAKLVQFTSNLQVILSSLKTNSFITIGKRNSFWAAAIRQLRISFGI